MNHKHDFSINDLKKLNKNPHYKKYIERKEEIKKKYNPSLWKHYGVELTKKDYVKWYIEEAQEEWRNYLKEIADVMFEPDGDFQKFTWDIMSEVDKLTQQRTARGKRSRKIDY